MKIGEANAISRMPQYVMWLQAALVMEGFRV